MMKACTPEQQKSNTGVHQLVNDATTTSAAVAAALRLRTKSHLGTGRPMHMVSQAKGRQLLFVGKMSENLNCQKNFV